MAYDEALLGKGGYHTSAFSYINISLMLLLHQENQSKNQSAFLFFLNNIRAQSCELFTRICDLNSDFAI